MGKAQIGEIKLKNVQRKGEGTGDSLSFTVFFNPCSLPQGTGSYLFDVNFKVLLRRK